MSALALTDQISGNGWIMALVGLLVLFILVLAFLAWRLSRMLRNSQFSERLVRDDIVRLSSDFTRQIDGLKESLAGRVAESNRDQREINALFIGQMQQMNQGNGQLLENMRRTVSDNLAKVAREPAGNANGDGRGPFIKANPR